MEKVFGGFEPSGVSHIAIPQNDFTIQKWCSMGDSFIVRASCSADPDKRVHSISVMDPGFPVCVWGGTIDPCPRPAPAGIWGSGCKLLHSV